MSIAKEDITLDGISYELSVREGPNGYYGAFFCTTCGWGWAKYDLPLPTINEALNDARHRAVAHHSEIHADSDFVISEFRELG